MRGSRGKIGKSLDEEGAGKRDVYGKLEEEERNILLTAQKQLSYC